MATLIAARPPRTRPGRTRPALPRPTRALLPVAALALAATSAPLPAAEAEKTALALAEAMAVMRVYFTCSALDPETQQFLADYWAPMVAETLAYLRERGLAPANLDEFAASALPEALLPAPETPLSALRAYCLADTDWIARLAAFDLPQLPNALEALEETE